MKTKILFVCLGNICRSPAAEAIFLHNLEEKNLLDLFVVDSAGTGGWHVGRKADSRMREAAANRGVFIKSKARQISVDDFCSFDLILTMDHSNLVDVKTLFEESSIASKVQIKPLLEYSKNTDLLEVPDPYYGGQNGFDQVLDLLEDAIEGLISKLTN